MQRISDEFDPRRCKGLIRKGTEQCFMISESNSNYCMMHGGNKAVHKKRKQDLFNYRLGKWKARFADLSDSDIKDLKGEIALVRFLIQQHLDVAEQEQDILIYGAALSNLFAQLDKLAQACSTIDKSLTQLMDKDNAIELVQKMIETVSMFGSYPELFTGLIDLLDKFYEEPQAGKAVNYDLGQWQQEVSKYMTKERLTNLRGEIGVARVLVEERLKACNDPYDLLTHSREICGYVEQIQKLVTSCHRLEKSYGVLLDREAALIFVQEILTVVQDHIKDAELISKISTIYSQS